jgi:hypothetical protein
MSDEYDDIPEPIRRAFAVQPYLPAPTVARLLGVSIKTLRRHEKAGNIRGQQLGIGQIRPRIFYSLADVAAFIRLCREGKVCLADENHRRSLSTHDHRTGNAIFRSRVIDFKVASNNSELNVTRPQRKRN